MRMVDLIVKTRVGGDLTREEMIAAMLKLL